MRRTQLTALALSLLACNGGKPTGTDTDEPVAIDEVCVEDDECESDEICDDEACVPGDRDNSIDEATLLRFDEPRSGVINPAGDKDYFSFETLSPGQWVLLQTTNERATAEDLDTVVRIYQANGLEHAAMDNYDLYRISGADSSLVAYLPTAGTWYVSVEDVSTYYELSPLRGSSRFSYGLELTSFSANTAEGGDPLLVELETGTRISRRGVLIGNPGDADQLVLRAPFAGQVLQVSATGANGSQLVADVSFELDGELLMRQRDLRSGSYGQVLQSVADDYLVTVTDAAGGGSADHWTVLYFRTYDPGASVTFWGTTVYEPEEEPNDDDVTANVLLRSDQTTTTGLNWSGAFLEGRIDGEGDSDWFKFTIDPGNLFTIRCYADRFGSLVDLGLEILRDDLSPIETVSDYDVWSAPQRYNLEGGEARYVRVFAEDDSFGPGAYYRCTVVESDWEVAE